MFTPHALLEPLSYTLCHIEDLLAMPQGAFQHKTTCEDSQSGCVLERNISKASHAQLWFTIETLPHPCNALSEGVGCTGTRAPAGWLEQEFQPQTHRSKPRSRGRYQPCDPHVGPITTERLHPGNAFVLPDLGPPMSKHVQRQPHTLGLSSRFSSVGHHCPIAGCLHMQATQPSTVRCRPVAGDCVEDPASSTRMPKLKVSSDVVQHVSNSPTSGNMQSGLEGGMLCVPIYARCTICDPHDVQNCTICRYMERPPLSYLLE